MLMTFARYYSSTRCGRFGTLPLHCAAIFGAPTDIGIRKSGADADFRVPAALKFESSAFGW